MARLVAVGLERAGKVALRHLHVADLVVRHRQIALPAGVAGIGLRQPLSDGEAVAVGLERAGKVALRHLHIANLLVRHRQLALEVRASGIAGKQVRHDLPGLLGGGERARRVADRQQRCGGFKEGLGLAALELRRHLPGFDELLLQRARPVENILDETGGDSHDVAEPLRQVEDQTVGGFGRGRERRFGAPALLFGILSLLVRDPLLFDGNSALPIGEPGKRQRDDKAGGKAPGEDVAPPGGAASARGDEGLRLCGRLRCAAGA